MLDKLCHACLWTLRCAAQALIRNDINNCEGSAQFIEDGKCNCRDTVPKCAMKIGAKTYCNTKLTSTSQYGRSDCNLKIRQTKQQEDYYYVGRWEGGSGGGGAWCALIHE